MLRKEAQREREREAEVAWYDGVDEINDVTELRSMLLKLESKLSDARRREKQAKEERKDLERKVDFVEKRIGEVSDE